VLEFGSDLLINIIDVLAEDIEVILVMPVMIYVALKFVAFSSEFLGCLPVTGIEPVSTLV